MHCSPYFLAASYIATTFSLLTSLHSIYWKAVISLITSE